MIRLETLREWLQRLGPYVLLALLPGGFLLAPLLLVARRREVRAALAASLPRRRRVHHDGYRETWDGSGRHGERP